MKKIIILMFSVMLCASVSLAQGVLGTVQADGKTIVQAAEIEGTVTTNVLPATVVYTDKANTFSVDQNLGSNDVTNVKSLTLSDASVKLIDGKVNGTNYVGFVDSSNNTFRILLVLPTP